MEKCHVPVAWQHTTWLQIKQLGIDVPVGTIHQTCQLLVRDADNAAKSVLPSSACAVIYGVMSHVHIINTPSSTNVIVELDGLLQASKHIAETWATKQMDRRRLEAFEMGIWIRMERISWTNSH